MQLPKEVKEKKLKHKYCKIPECNKEFWGVVTAKYCDFHQNPSNRIRKKREFENVNVKNQTFPHNFTKVTSVKFNCKLSGCGQEFSIIIFPRQTIYPKYCEKHRNEFKRELFVREHK